MSEFSFVHFFSNYICRDIPWLKLKGWFVKTGGCKGEKIKIFRLDCYSLLDKKERFSPFTLLVFHLGFHLISQLKRIMFACTSFFSCIISYICTLIVNNMNITIDTSALIAVISNKKNKSKIIELTVGATLNSPISVHWEIGNAFSAMFKEPLIKS